MLMLLFDGVYFFKASGNLGKGTLLNGPFRKGGGDDGYLQLTVYGNVVHQRVQGASASHERPYVKVTVVHPSAFPSKA